MPEIGLQGQLNLKKSSVLIIGAGGLGCPAAIYLAGAGVGHIGIVDGDVVEESNLHRQILHGGKVGTNQAWRAFTSLKALNPLVRYTVHDTHLSASNALAIFAGYTCVLDCTDNPAARYLISDTCVLLGIPLVSASALRTDGQLMLLNYPAVPPGGNGGDSSQQALFLTRRTVVSVSEGPLLRCS